MTKNPPTAPQTYHRDLTDGDADPEVALVHALAEIEGVDESELTQLFSSINDMVDRLFHSPPPAETMAELTFSYGGYRITVYQDGHAVFRRLDGA